jgi:predicted Zn-dependent protease with MMP-like domain
VVEVTRDEFESMVADALDEIPDELAEELDNVVVLVEDWPTAEQLADAGDGDPDGAREIELFGLYEGVPAIERGPLSYAGVAPDRITIFQGPLSRVARDRADLAAQVRITVLHEVGHWFGMTDERLHEMGWA